MTLFFNKKMRISNRENPLNSSVFIDMSTIFLQQILNGKLLLIVIVGTKKLS